LHAGGKVIDTFQIHNKLIPDASTVQRAAIAADSLHSACKDASFASCVSFPRQPEVT